MKCTVGKLVGAMSVAMLLSILWFSTGCETQLSNSTPTRGGATNDVPIGWLQPNDLVTVVYSGVVNPPDKHEERIKEDGYIQLDLVGRVKAAGKTAGQLQDEIQKLYVPAYFKTNTLTVTVQTEGRFFFVSGEVKTPGRIAHVGEMTVLKAIAAAGDFTDFAARWKVVLTRMDGKQYLIDANKARKDSSKDMQVFPGDTIHVPQRPI